MDSFLELAAEYADLSDSMKSHKNQMNAAKERMAEIEPALLDLMADNCLDTMRVKGRTIYIRRQLWPKYEDRQAVVQALRNSGYDDLLSESFNTNTLAAVIREMDASGEPLPGEWSGVLDKQEKVTLQTRKAS